MEVGSTSQTLVILYQAKGGNNQGDSHFHDRRRENLKTHKLILLKNDKWHFRKRGRTKTAFPLQIFT
jgi:hypothetical protein